MNIFGKKKKEDEAPSQATPMVNDSEARNNTESFPDSKEGEAADATTLQSDSRREEEIKKLEAENEEELEIINKAIEMLRTVYDPEIPVNVYDLGLIYKIDYDKKDKNLHVDMTLTAPHCPMADFIMEDVRQKLLSVEGPEKLDLRLVFEPQWNQDMMSEEAKLELGYL